MGITMQGHNHYAIPETTQGVRQLIVRKEEERGSSTGLNRTFRWTGSVGPPAAKSGNAANAELAAGSRAKEVIKRRRAIFGKVKCLSTVSEACIGTDHSMEAGCYGFAMIGSEIVLARVKTMYAKNGGKAGAHAWTPKCESIGALSYLVVQVYQHSYRRQFKMIHRSDVFLGTLRYAHLPSNSFLALVGLADDTVKTFRDHVEIDGRSHKIFEDLMAERELLAKAVASLNTMRRKGQANINIMELPEDDGVEE
ncbi:hypothetical protein B0H10DRAFT_2329151 [Mycena sp. CBHHK59/15]|nr:hypothetical protein B0H10DRAFT_2329151 [Mycena sp. CBHHK59/15]